MIAITPSDVTPVWLTNKSTKEAVDAELWHGIVDKNLADWEAEWIPDLQRRLKLLNQQKVERRFWPQSRHWDWRDKLREIERRLANLSFALVADGMTEAMMTIDLTKRARLPGHEKQHLVYVNFLEAAPWNRNDLAEEPAKFAGCGSILINAAVQQSMLEGFKGRIGLHSLPQSNSFYANACGMTDPGRSETYNPLAGAVSAQAIADLSKTLVRSANGRGQGQAPNDPFWEQAAEKLIRILAQCLLNQPDPSLRNLTNLRHLVANFDAHVAPNGQLGKIDQFVLSATQNDPTTFSAYRAFVQGNLKTIQSVLMSADVALDPLATPEMAALTASNSLDFAELRQRPVALYIIVNQTQMDLYAFLLNLFYAELFRALLNDHRNPGRPVWLFLDEFGHLQIPGFEVFATTARKYKVSYTLFLQSMAQLEGRYGGHNARTIVDGLGTEIYLPGTSLETARQLEARLGRRAKAPLMAASDIIRMEEHEALMLYSNRLPVLLKTKRYYQWGDLRRRAKFAPAHLPQNTLQYPTLINL